MSSAGLRFILFALLFLVLPVPLFGFEGSFVPLARLLQLGLVLGVLIGLEGGGGLVGVIAGLFFGHVVILGALLFAGVWLLERWLLSRLTGSQRIAGLFAVAIALVAWGALASPYDSQFHHSDAHASLLEIYR